MNPKNISKLPILLVFISFTICLSSANTHKHFLQCLSLYSSNSTSISKVIFTRNNSSYSSILQSSIQNLRFNSTFTPKPFVIVTPLEILHIQATITCSKKHRMQIRIRSGGHDFEGLSYVSMLPFVILDLSNFQEITVDVQNSTAWVQSGATIGQLYYKIAEKSKTLAFPAGDCPSVGVGGHFSGGGYGTMLRKYGLAADNIINALLIDVNGRVLDRASMGEDVFWAIRGGGGNSFGVVIAWRVKLVNVPPRVTVFTVQRTLEQNATQLVNQWQYIADKLHEDLFIRIMLTTVNNSSEIQATFDSLFLGGINRLLPLMQESFPELGLVTEDCIEMSWIESTVYFSGYPRNSSLDVLLDRTSFFLTRFKGKSDYVKQPIPINGLEGIWQRFYELEAGDTIRLFLAPYGGKMREISESSIPFPHRAGNIYKIFYLISWGTEEGIETSQRHISWIRRLYSYMAPYVSKNPREAFVNYRDLDIGINNQGNTSYRQASIWGVKYFKNNFDRLVHVKTTIDPSNFFRNEQSIPPLSSWSMGS